MNALSPMPETLAPACLQTEQALIGAVLLNPASIDKCRDIRPEHFFDPAHAAVWQRVMEFGERGERVEAPVIMASFNDAPIAENGMTMRRYIARMLAEATTITGAGYYAKAVKEMWALRSVTEIGAGVARQFGQAMPSDLLNAAFDQVEAIRADMIELAASRPRTAGDIGCDVLAAAQERAQGGGQRAPSTGLPDLDVKLPMRGLAPGSLFVIGGRTGMGKSMLLSSMARNAARNTGVAFFSLEVGAEEMSARMLSDIVGDGPTYEEILADKMDNAGLEAVHVANRTLARLPIMIDPRAGQTLGEMERAATSFADHIAKKDIKLGLLVIDHAQIVKAGVRYQGNRVGELGEIANGAKVLAKRLGCCVALASQINRSVEKNGDESKRPTIADLRGSGEIEEAADCIGLLYRPAYYIERSAKFKEGDPGAQDELARAKNDLELAIDKSRQGRTGAVNLWCDPARSIVRCKSNFYDQSGGRH